MKKFTRRTMVKNGIILFTAPAIIGKAKARLLIGTTSSVPPPSFSHPHAIAAAGSTITSVTTSAIDTTGCNLLFLCTGTFGTSETLTDSVSTNWAASTGGYQLTGGGGGYGSLSYQASPTTSASYTATVSNPTPAPIIAAVALPGYTGTTTETENGSTGATNTLPALASATGEFLFAMVQHDNTSLPTIDSGFTIIDQLASVAGVSYGLSTAFLIGIGTSPTPTWTFSGASNSAAILVNFTGTYTP